MRDFSIFFKTSHLAEVAFSLRFLVLEITDSLKINTNLKTLKSQSKHRTESAEFKIEYSLVSQHKLPFATSS